MVGTVTLKVMGELVIADGLLRGAAQTPRKVQGRSEHVATTYHLVLSPIRLCHQKWTFQGGAWQGRRYH